MTTFEVIVPTDPAKLKRFQEIMNQIHNETNKYSSELAVQLNVSEACAADVWYLRTRSRWTQELENRLIQEHRDGKSINIIEFP